MTTDTRPGGVALRRRSDRQGGSVLAKRAVGADDSTTVAVIETAKQAGVYPEDPDRLLNDVVDPDALERIFADKISGKSRQGGRVTFEMWGLTFVVTADEVVAIE